MCIENASIKRKGQVSTLQTLKPGVIVDDKKVHMDPTILFTRLVAMVQKEDDVEQQFAFELTPEPRALFKDGMLRKPQKENLRKHLLSKSEQLSA